MTASKNTTWASKPLPWSGGGPCAALASWQSSLQEARSGALLEPGGRRPVRRRSLARRGGSASSRRMEGGGAAAREAHWRRGCWRPPAKGHGQAPPACSEMQMTRTWVARGANESVRRDTRARLRCGRYETSRSSHFHSWQGYGPSQRAWERPFSWRHRTLAGARQAHCHWGRSASPIGKTATRTMNNLQTTWSTGGRCLSDPLGCWTASLEMTTRAAFPAARRCDSRGFGAGRPCWTTHGKRTSLNCSDDALSLPSSSRSCCCSRIVAGASSPSPHRPSSYSPLPPSPSSPPSLPPSLRSEPSRFRNVPCQTPRTSLSHPPCPRVRGPFGSKKAPARALSPASPVPAPLPGSGGQTP